MHKVKGKEEYIENWLDFRDEVCFILLDAAIAVGLLLLMLVCVVPIALLCTAGWSPEVNQDEESGRGDD